MSTYNPVGAQTYVLGTSISSTDTTIILSSFLEPVTGTPYTMALINSDIVYATIAPKTSSSEFISFTTIVQNVNGTATLGGVTRGLAKKYPFTTDVAYKLPHSGQSQFILSDAPQVFEEYASLGNSQTITGVKTFTTSPVVPTGGTGTQAANATDIANAISGASGTATTTVFGTVKTTTATNTVVSTDDTRLPTQGENDALVGDNTDIAVGTGNKFVTQTGLQHNAEKYAADAGANDTYVITLSPVPTSYTNGMVVYFKANTINTGAATINVNSLGAKTIVKGVNTTLADGDIAAGQLCTVIYDGTNFVLQNPVATVPAVASGISFVSSDIVNNSNSNQNIDTTVTCGFAPKVITLYYSIQGSANTSETLFSQGVAVYNSAGTLIINQRQYENQASNSTTVVIESSVTAPTAGSATPNFLIVTLSIQSVTATSFVVRAAYTSTGTPYLANVLHCVAVVTS